MFDVFLSRRLAFTIITYMYMKLLYILLYNVVTRLVIISIPDY